MKNAIVIVACVVAVCAPSLVAAQTGTDKPKPTAQAVFEKTEEARLKQKLQEAEAALMNPRFVRTLTNVQIELTLTDQTGTNPADKKTVSMVVSSGSWGKVRSSGIVDPIDGPPYPVELNVDARPFVAIEGPVQVEMTFVYAPMKSAGETKEGARQRPAGINQSQTVVLQSGKPLIVSQAADPISDRKVVVEIKATVLK